MPVVGVPAAVIGAVGAAETTTVVAVVCPALRDAGAPAIAAAPAVSAAAGSDEAGARAALEAVPSDAAAEHPSTPDNESAVQQ